MLDDFWEILGAIVISVIIVSSILFLVYISDDPPFYAEIQECEKELPRDQKCVMVAIPGTKEK